MSFNKCTKEFTNPQKRRNAGKTAAQARREILEFTLDYQQTIRKNFRYTDDNELMNLLSNTTVKKTSSLLE
ncbi:uncharacterized protein OCT59_023475 [Rhizophagus irregularis]|uniref:uncharacterized protein n=1 Tax=Rhizophagus irregularis TaxID=588596 RepID=UPI003333A086|nr:hypothetical protein OCT59_023475 [Rhizophagus irregularis]